MASMGFTLNQQTQNNDWKLSGFQIIVITILSIDVGTLCVFLFYEANGIEEYMDAIVGMLVVFLSVGGVVLLAAFMLPQIIISYFVYFTMHSDSDAFILLLQTW